MIDEEELEKYGELVGDGSRCSPAVMECILLDIIDKDIKEANISQQFYGLFVYEYMKRMELRGKWKALLALPEHEQLLIQGTDYRLEKEIIVMFI